ncbi:hypothetical protein BS47DRAFT_1366333 [Hydnum rufescens UP504]|uniref:GRF-type domain-containing protein n=1 Tax=Hydnum rufescens UP504 TaxID=1448309 RepID=A0A9P6DMD6_9AGAM|nr:hypothetical protein BS47DRAFT_1366333 [Hydnum rufescens UP504]
MGRWVIKHNVEFRNNKLLCKCSVFARICVVGEGPNQDKCFYACSSGSKCGFLFWAEQPPDAEDDKAEPNNDGVEGNGSDFKQEIFPLKVDSPANEKHMIILQIFIAVQAHGEIILKLEHIRAELAAIHLEMAMFRNEVSSLHMDMSEMWADIGLSIAFLQMTLLIMCDILERVILSVISTASLPVPISEKSGGVEGPLWLERACQFISASATNIACTRLMGWKSYPPHLTPLKLKFINATTFWQLLKPTCRFPWGCGPGSGSFIVFM